MTIYVGVFPLSTRALLKRLHGFMIIEASGIEEGETGESRLTIFSPLMKWQCSTDSRKEIAKEDVKKTISRKKNASGVKRFPNMELDCQSRLLQIRLMWDTLTLSLRAGGSMSIDRDNAGSDTMLINICGALNCLSKRALVERGDTPTYIATYRPCSHRCGIH
ncbi:hypothetical protein LXL04_013360 [Taraxacum kok-saghyz]